MNEAYNDIDFTSDVLTDEEIKKAVKLLLEASDKNPPNLKKITQDITGDPKQSGRTKKGREVKRLSEDYLGINIPSSHEYHTKVPELSTEKQQTVDANLPRFAGRLLDLTRFVFNNVKITNLHGEYRAVEHYVKSIHKLKSPTDRKVIDQNFMDGDEFQSPSTPLLTLRLVKKLVPTCRLDEDDLRKSKIEFMMSRCRDYLQDRHFLIKVNSYLDTTRRELFLSSFIKQVYDKPDLTEEERDQYLAACSEIVMQHDINARLEDINEITKHITETSDSEVANFKMGFVEKSKDQNDAYDKSRKRYEAAMKNLTTIRSKKLDNHKEEQMSIVQLYTWLTEEKNRKRFARVAEARREEVKKSYKKFNDCDSLKAEIWGGLSEHEVLNG
ncbi:MAG: hypothetical protein ISP56_06535 [Flavobacteriaceae bacterium]|nr:hypothetical protein [Flavobacteriaceae bacterium]